MLDLRAYLSRIGYAGSTQPTAENLRAIHRAHLLTVPFENLDIGLGREIPCDANAAIRKIVERRRGGFCYEMNGAFATLLCDLGFQVTLLSARVARENGGEGLEFDHLTLLVDLQEPWLADVGFGESFMEPLRLQLGLVQTEKRRSFRIVEDGERLCLEMTEPEGTWKREYSFTLNPRRLEEFAGMCHYHQTSPESHFTRKRICTRATEDGRVTIADYKLIVTRNGQREERMLGSEEGWREALKEYFGVVL
jgi:N-hydroxyarylamine O-acetyltransferase